MPTKKNGSAVMICRLGPQITVEEARTPSQAAESVGPEEGVARAELNNVLQAATVKAESSVAGSPAVQGSVGSLTAPFWQHLGFGDCAVLWGVGRQLGVFNVALPETSPAVQLVRKHHLSEVSATYAAAAAAGSFLGRLAWGEERLGGISAAQRRGDMSVPVRNVRGGCMEALEAVLAVASNAAQDGYLFAAFHWLRPLGNRLVASQSYALASQLASDGHADGLAAKAEMLYFGRSSVLPGSGAGGRA
eukprot:s8077_g1.t1